MRELVRRRWFRVLALALLLPLPAWILLCNVLLWTGAIAAIVSLDGKVTSLRLSHGRAYMLWPSVVHVRDAKFTIDTYSYQLALFADEAVVDIRLFALFDRRVHIEHAQATGLWAEYRGKIDRAEQGDPNLAAYPPFDGTPPQLHPDEPKPRPAPDEAWSVDIDDVDAEVARAWIDEFDVEPLGHVRGAYHWVDAGALSVPTTTVRLDGAGLWLGASEALRGLDGQVTFSFSPFETTEVPAAKTPRYLGFVASMHGELHDPGALGVWWPHIAEHLVGAPGPIAIEARAEDGRLRPGTRIHHRSGHASYRDGPLRLTGAPELALEIADDGRGRARVWLRDAVLHGKRVGALAHAPELHAELWTAHADMTRRWSIAAVHATGEEIRADDLRRISETIGSRSVRLTRGRARGRARVDMGADLVPHATFETRVRDGVLVAGEVEIGAALRSSGQLTWTKRDGLVAEDLELRSDDVTVKSKSGTSKGTWVRLDHGAVRWKGDRISVETRGEIEDARPAIVHLTRLDPFLRMVPDLGRIAPVKVRGKLEVDDGVVEIELVDAEQLGLHVAATWRERGGDWRIAMLASGLAAVGLTSTEGERVPRPVVLVGRKWYERQRRWVRALGR
jgi:hypothetical protein